MVDHNKIFSISTSAEFELSALAVFKYQYLKNEVYHTFCNHLGRTDKTVKSIEDIPFLPIEFFKTKKVTTGVFNATTTFISSGTTGQSVSKHYIKDLELYKKSYQIGFELFYGAISNRCILALLPSYLERSGSSLIYMVNDLINRSNHPDSDFYLNDIESLISKLEKLDKSGVKTLLIGVSFALLDLVEFRKLQLKNTIVMETGGMKGRRKELIREELHDQLKKGFGVSAIHSEYGMTELLSQAYSIGNGVFKTPPWMKVLIRDTEDPLTYLPFKKTGGVNVIDLANIHSCSFIATQDLGKLYEDGSFEVLGRFDHSDIRGCNLLVL